MYRHIVYMCILYIYVYIYIYTYVCVFISIGLYTDLLVNAHPFLFFGVIVSGNIVSLCCPYSDPYC